MRKVILQNLPNNIKGIYKIDFPNGKSYIGQSKDIKNRIKRHNEVRNCPELLVEYAIRKYGVISKFYILEEGDFDQDELNKKEMYWIHYYDTINREKGYNIKGGGMGSCVPPKFNKEVGIEIAFLIFNNKTIRFQEIANKYNCHVNTIKKINQGISPYNYSEFFIYPIRNCDESRVLRAFLGEDKIKDILKELRETKKSMTVIGNEYNLCRNTISDINKGKKEPLKNYDYPARKT